MVIGFEFCDSWLCEVPNAEEREKTWVSYERWGMVVNVRSTNVNAQRPTFSVQVLFFGVASILGNEIPMSYLKKQSSQNGLLFAHSMTDS